MSGIDAVTVAATAFAASGAAMAIVARRRGAPRTLATLALVCATAGGVFGICALLAMIAEVSR